MKYSALLLMALLLAAGCARDRPIVDTKGVNPVAYRQDLAECQNYARQVETGRQVAGGVAAGAVVGGLFGAAVGDSDTAKRGAGAGSVAGGARGAGHAAHEKEQVVRNCLRGRGYRVLN
ncbi:MAG: glycine zipper family protein [Gammaproteobacteria bacterium]